MTDIAPPADDRRSAPPITVPTTLWPCAAILLGGALGPARYDAWPVMLAFGVCVLAIGVVSRSGTAWIIALVLLALAGSLWHAAPPPPTPILWPAQPVTAVRGAVRDWPTPHGETVQARVDVTAARTERGWEPAMATLTTTLPPYPVIGRGDTVTAGGIVTIRRGWWRGADGSLYGEWVRGEPRPENVSADTIRHRVVTRLVAGIERFIRPPESGLTAGILLGEKTTLDDETRAALNATGTTQHVVISGWNISIVIGFLALIGRRLRVGRRGLWFCLSLGAVTLYTFAVGAEPSVVRAAIMGAGGLVAPLLGRRADPLVWLGIATAAMTMHDPAVVRDLSFLLSCLATFGVLVVAPWLARQFARVALAQRFPRLTEAAAVAVSAQLLTEPLILHAFGRVSLIGPFVNLIVEPLVPVIMLLGFVTALLSLVPLPFIASVAGLSAACPAWLFLHIVRLAASLPAAAPTLPQPGTGLTLALYLVPLLTFVWLRAILPALRLRAPSLRLAHAMLYAASFVATLGTALAAVSWLAG